MKRILTSALLAALLPLSSFAASYTFTQNTGVFTTTTGLAHGQAATWGLDGASYTAIWNAINNQGLKVTSATLTLTGIYDWQGEGTTMAPLDPADALFVNILSGLDAGVKTKQFAPGTGNSTSWSSVKNPFVDQAGTQTDGSDFNDNLQNSSSGYPGVLKFNDAGAGSLLQANSATTKVGTPSTVTWSDPDGPATTSTLVITFSQANLAVLKSLIDADNVGGTTNGDLAPNVGLGFAAECHYYMTSASLSITVPDSGGTIALMGLGFLALAGFRRFKK